MTIDHDPHWLNQVAAAPIHIYLRRDTLTK
jgi:hypothetical protein